MSGKTLAELRTEIEMGFGVYPLPDGYCCVHKTRYADGRVEYIYSACDDEWWPSFDEMLEGMGECGTQSIWTTFDAYTDRHDIEELNMYYDSFHRMEESGQG